MRVCTRCTRLRHTCEIKVPCERGTVEHVHSCLHKETVVISAHFLCAYIWLPVTHHYAIMEESELHHSIGSPIDGAHPGPNTDRDYLGRYCP